MKTKILIILAATIAYNATALQAQTKYYQQTTTYDVEDGVTYKCDVDDGMVTLYNSKNIYTYKDWTFLDGSKIPIEMESGSIRVFTMTRESDTDIKNRVNSAFTTEQKQIIGDIILIVSMVIDPQTGKIIEIFFEFMNKDPYKYNLIPPSVFRQIEQNFLSRPVIPGFAVTDIGRGTTHITMKWGHKLK